MPKDDLASVGHMLDTAQRAVGKLAENHAKISMLTKTYDWRSLTFFRLSVRPPGKSLRASGRPTQPSPGMLSSACVTRWSTIT